MKSCENCKGSSFTFIKKQTNGWSIERCNSCALVQVVPKPTKKEIDALYENDWPHFSPYQSQRRTHHIYFSKLLTYILKELPRKKTPRLLDIGCATGVLLAEAAKRGIHAIGVDVSHDAVSYCREHGLNAFEGDVEDIAQKKKWSKQYDIVVACQVIEHVRDPQEFFRTLGTIVTPGGVIVVTTPNYDTWWRRLMGSAWIGYQHPEHLFFFTPQTLTAFFQNAGFLVTGVQRDFPRPYGVGYAFRRLGEYIPSMKCFFGSFERLFLGVQISIPFNPWGDFLIIGQKLV